MPLLLHILLRSSIHSSRHSCHHSSCASFSPDTSLGTRKVEWIGPMEQVFMDIACLSADVREETTHMELCPDAMLSQVASMTPYSDYNQSPRNMYQVRVTDGLTDRRTDRLITLILHQTICTLTSLHTLTCPYPPQLFYYHDLQYVDPDLYTTVSDGQANGGHPCPRPQIP